MINRRIALGLIASVSAVGVSSVTLAKEKHHLNGQALLGDKIKQNGKHKIHTAGKVERLRRGEQWQGRWHERRSASFGSGSRSQH
jgi:hypothetical protein